MSIWSFSKIRSADDLKEASFSKVLYYINVYYHGKISTVRYRIQIYLYAYSVVRSMRWQVCTGAYIRGVYILHGSLYIHIYIYGGVT